MHRLQQIREHLVYGKRQDHTWRQAATRYLLEEEHKRSIDRDAQALRLLDPYLGDLPLKSVHMGTLAQYIGDQKSAGTRSGTVRRDLATVRRILNLAAGEWRDDLDKTWLEAAPKIRLPDWGDQRQPYPLTWEEQRTLFKLLPEHLHNMALFKVNTGTREQEVCGLRWHWEIEVPALETTMFLIPKGYVKNKDERLVVLNRIAHSVAESQRGQHPTHVFTYRGKPIQTMDDTAWRKAWREAGLPVEADIRRAVHNLKHTCARLASR
jgi:integrase